MSATATVDSPSFLRKYELARLLFVENDFAQFDTSCRDASRDLERLSVWQTAQQKALKSRFNVFTAVLKHDDEVRLHTRWLHYLLDRTAEHDCDALFLDLFIKTLRRVGAQPHRENAETNRLDDLRTFDSKTAEVKKELPTRHGNLDIHIESPKWGVIVIENKTKSGEGDNQIYDYAEYCIQHCRGRKRRKRILLFLTPDGRQAETAGKHKGEYHRISYREHILPWLEESLRETYQYAHINQALQQYKNVVNQILNLSSDSAYMKEFTEILKKHPCIIERLDKIGEAVEDIRKSYWNDFVSELLKQLGKLGISVGKKESDDWSDSFELKPSDGGQRVGYPKLITTLQFNKWIDVLLIGEALSFPEKEKRRRFQKNKGKFGHLTKRLDDEFPQHFDKGDGHDYWWPVGFVELHKEFMKPKFLAKNATQDSRPMPKQVEDVVKAISRYLKVLKENWPKADP